MFLRQVSLLVCSSYLHSTTSENPHLAQMLQDIGLKSPEVCSPGMLSTHPYVLAQLFINKVFVCISICFQGRDGGERGGHSFILMSHGLRTPALSRKCDLVSAVGMTPQWHQRGQGHFLFCDSILSLTIHLSRLLSLPFATSWRLAA